MANKDILKRVSVFDDSEEMVAELFEVADLFADGDVAAYWITEACEQIDGLWILVNQMADEIKRLRRG